MLTPVLIGVAVLLVLFVVVVSMRPSEFRVTRSALIPVPVTVVFPLVNTLRRWDAWSPWAKLDPNATNSFEDPESGKGAAMSWSGNNKVGQGRMEIIASRANEFIQFKLEFLKPMKATNTAEFSFGQQGDQTTVTWAMYGRNNFLGKAFGLFVNCDTMLGREFEKGLEQMKSVAKAAFEGSPVHSDAGESIN